MKDFTLEICAASYESAVAAKRGGAQRIELCSVLPVGGVTPSAGLINLVCSSVSIDVNVLLRPRPGDFLYSSYEAEEVLRDIEVCSAAGARGVVVGALTDQGDVDRTMCMEWLKSARRHNLTITFHRAIDRASDIFGALDEIMSMGYDRILTSGGFSTAPEGVEVLEKMNRQAAGHVIIMPGSGVKPSNMGDLVRRTGVSEVHFSASKTRPSLMKKFGGIGEQETLTHSDEGAIREAVKLLSEI